MTNTKPIAVLHVEDDGIAQKCISFYLKSMPDRVFDIQCALSEDDGIAQFERGGVGLVILDYRLRHGNGLSFLRRLRHLDELVPVIVLSSESKPEISKELFRNGADAFLMKGDLTGESLIEQVREVLDRAGRWKRLGELQVGNQHRQASPVRELLAATG